MRLEQQANPGAARPSLRQATPADLEAVYRLECEGFVPGIVETEAVFARRIERFPEGFFLAERSGQALGYWCGELWSGLPRAADGSWRSEAFDLGHDIDSQLDRRGRVLYVASMTIAQSLRGSGLGAWLFQAGIAAARERFPGLEQAVLIVNEHWLGAHAIYRKAGFSEQGRIPGFFRPAEGPQGDAIIMARRLA